MKKTTKNKEKSTKARLKVGVKISSKKNKQLKEAMALIYYVNNGWNIEKVQDFLRKWR